MPIRFSTLLKIFFYLLLLPVYLGGCGDAVDQVTSNSSDNKANNPLLRIQISAASTVLAKNTRLQLSAIGFYQNNTKQDISDTVSWSSSDISTATFQTPAGMPQTKGRLHALRSGKLTVSAVSGEISSAAIDIRVTNAVLQSIRIGANTSESANNLRIPFQAVAQFSDGNLQDFSSNVSWFSSATDIAFFENSAVGTLLTSGIGNTTIQAKYSDVTSNGLTYTIVDKQLLALEIDPATINMSVDTQKQLIATGIFDDGSKQDLTGNAIWLSSDFSIASVNNQTPGKGRLRIIKSGTVSISVNMGDTFSPAIALTISSSPLESITISPSQASNPLGFRQQFQATALFADSTVQDITQDVIWLSSNPTVSDIDNSPLHSGRSLSRATGETQISAVFRNVLSTPVTQTISDASVTAITISPLVTSLSKGGQQRFTAIAKYSDGTEQDMSNNVTWKSSAEGIAIISNGQETVGTATAVASGNALISATYFGIGNTQESNDATLTVVNARLSDILITSSAASVALGKTAQFTAQGRYDDGSSQPITNRVTWKSSAALIATISNAANMQGLLSTHDRGETSISATMGGISKQFLFSVSAAELQQIVLKPATATIKRTQTLQFSATGIFSNGPRDITNSATWSSTNTGIATVSAGYAVPQGIGSTTINAALGPNIVAAALLNTEASTPTIVVTAASTGASVQSGDLVAFTASGGTSPYDWSVDSNIATIDKNSGLFLAILPGQVTITATDVNGITGRRALTITP